MEMKKTGIANGILAASAAAALVSAPFMDVSPLWGGMFHLSFAATVAGFADWFGTASLFGKPLGIPFRTDLIFRNRNKILSMAKDMVMKELLTERRMKALLTEHTASSVVEGWIGQNRKAVEKMITDAFLVILSGVDKDWLWEVTGGNLSQLAEETDWAAWISSVMKSFKTYEGRNELLFVLSREVRSFLQNEFTLEEVRKIYLSAWNKYEDTGWLGLHRIFKNAMKDREEEMVALVREKIISLSDMLTDSESEVSALIERKYDEIANRLAHDALLKQKVNHRITGLIRSLLEEKGRDFSGRLWERKKEDIASLASEKVLSLADDMLKNDEKRRSFDAFLLRSILPYVSTIHQMVGQVVEMKLEKFDGKALSELAEEGTGDDVAMIRINGSLSGAILGLLFYVITHGGGAL